VPFGEFIPFRESFPLFRWVLGRLIPGDYQAGTSTKRLQLSDPRVDLIPTIRFEDTIGSLTRLFVLDEPGGPQIIVNLTTTVGSRKARPTPSTWRRRSSAVSS